jgi:hypothetical protein
MALRFGAGCFANQLITSAPSELVGVRTEKQGPHHVDMAVNRTGYRLGSKSAGSCQFRLSGTPYVSSGIRSSNSM